MPAKSYLDMDVLTAARARLDKVYELCDEVMVAFSGGKDSTALLHLAIEAAERAGRLPVRVMVVDLEGQYRATMDHVRAMFDDPRVHGEWICLPINLRNAVSHFEPHWACWDPAERERWVRPMPDHPAVVSDPSRYPFYRYRMEFEEFVPEYEEWLAKHLGCKRLGVLVGIRTDESLNRFRTIRRDNVRRIEGLKWSTAWGKDGSAANFYPIYDWGVEDVWTYLGRENLPYNKLYDMMHLFGTSVHEMRICQPYGDDQRVGLDQYHALEPDTWFRILQRVEGVNFGARYADDRFLGYRGGMGLPPGHTWKSYTKLLLASLPPDVAEHYKEKFVTFMLWWKARRKERGYPPMFDEGIVNPVTKRNIPSWQRLALCILKNDYWCHSLKFGQTKEIHEKQTRLKEKWGRL